jgi:hypothetical protein
LSLSEDSSWSSFWNSSINSRCLCVRFLQNITENRHLNIHHTIQNYVSYILALQEKQRPPTRSEILRVPTDISVGTYEWNLEIDFQLKRLQESIVLSFQKGLSIGTCHIKTLCTEDNVNLSLG